MKKYFLIFTIVIGLLELKGQDSLFFKSKDIKVVKVEEIGLNEIKYHSFDNLQGPMYIIGKSEIFKIKYPNGKVDTFAVAAPKIETAVVDQGSKESSYPVQRIVIRRKKLIYDYRTLNDKQMVNMIIKYPFPETKKIMLRDFNTAKTYKNRHYYGLGLVAVGIVVQFVGIANYSNPMFFLGGAAGIFGAVTSRVNKNKAATKRVQIAKMYNEWK
jgi:hypothetical protein